MDMQHTDHRTPTADAPQRKTRSAGFATLAFEQFGARLHSFLLRRLHRRDAAEDLAQEVYLRLLRFADKELVQSPEAYVYRVAFNVLHEFKLHERRSRVAYDSDTLNDLAAQIPDETESQEDVLELRARERQLEAALESLPPMQRAVFLLAKRHDMAHEDIARELGISMHTVRKYLYRTLHHCKQQMGRQQTAQGEPT